MPLRSPTSSFATRVDRLTLEDGVGPVEVQGEEDPVEMPEEEMLRLDDGTLLPPEITELRTLLALHSLDSSAGPSDVDVDADPERREMYAALSAAKADALRDCLLGFDEGLLLLHDKLLDHEALCKRLEQVRRRKRIAPVGTYRYDEAVSFDDGLAANSDAEDDDFALSDFLHADAPGGAGGEAGARKSAENDGVSDPDVGESNPEDEDEEALDQRVATSRQQIKVWLRALQEGKSTQSSTKESLSRGPALRPVIPPPKARQSSYSSRLRSTTSHYSAKFG